MSVFSGIDQLGDLESKYILFIVIAYSLAIILTSIVRKLMSVFINNRSKILKVDPTNYNFLKHAVSFIIFMLTTMIIFYRIPELRSLNSQVREFLLLYLLLPLKQHFRISFLVCLL